MKKPKGSASGQRLRWTGPRVTIPAWGALDTDQVVNADELPGDPQSHPLMTPVLDTEEEASDGK